MRRARTVRTETGDLSLDDKTSVMYVHDDCVVVRVWSEQAAKPFLMLRAIFQRAIREVVPLAVRRLHVFTDLDE